MELIDYSKIVWKYKWIMVLIIWVTVSATGVITYLIPPTYSATAKLQLSGSSTLPIPGYTSSNPNQEVNFNPNIELVKDVSFKKEVLDIAKREKKISGAKKLASFTIIAQPLGKTNFLGVTVETRNPKLAKILADAAALVLIQKSDQLESGTVNSARENINRELQVVDERLANLRRELENVKAPPSSGTEQTLEMAKLEDEIHAAESLRVQKRNNLELNNVADIDRENINRELQVVDERLANLRRELENVKAPPSSGTEQTLEMARIQDEINAVETSRRNYTDFLDKLSLNEKLQKGTLQLVYPAAVPSVRSRPKLFNNLLISVVASLFLGLGVVGVLSKSKFNSVSVVPSALTEAEKHQSSVKRKDTADF